MSYRDEKQILEDKEDRICLLMRLIQCEIRDWSLYFMVATNWPASKSHIRIFSIVNATYAVFSPI